MTDCRNCTRPTELFLCGTCVDQLADQLAALPWLTRQLQITVTRQDRLGTATVGRSPDNPSPINIGAMELARTIHTRLAGMHRDLCTVTGLTPTTQTSPSYAAWLNRHLNAIACAPMAGAIMADIRTIHHQILTAINRNSRMYCGPCTTVVAHDHQGADVECQHDLYADRETPDDIQCPRCKRWLNPREQLLTTIRRRDLLPEATLLDTLAVLGEPVSRVQLYGWIKAGQLVARGYVHDGRVVKHRVRQRDPRVFSLQQARDLRWRHQQAAS